MPNEKRKKIVKWLLIGLLLVGLFFGARYVYLRVKKSAVGTVATAMTTGPPTTGVSNGILGGVFAQQPQSGGTTTKPILASGPAPGGALNPVNHLPILVNGVKSLFGKR